MVLEKLNMSPTMGPLDAKALEGIFKSLDVKVLEEMRATKFQTEIFIGLDWVRT